MTFGEKVLTLAKSRGSLSARLLYVSKTKSKSDFEDENPITKTVQHLKIFERDGGR